MQKFTWIWWILALTKLQACLTSSNAFFLCTRCSGCCKSKTQATSILGLPGTVVCPDMSLCVPTLSVLEMPSMMPDCEAAAYSCSYMLRVFIQLLYIDALLHLIWQQQINVCMYQPCRLYRHKQKACCLRLHRQIQLAFLSWILVLQYSKNWVAITRRLPTHKQNVKCIFSLTCYKMTAIDSPAQI